MYQQNEILTDFIGVSVEYFVLIFRLPIGFITGELWLNISPSIKELNPGGNESWDYK